MVNGLYKVIGSLENGQSIPCEVSLQQLSTFPDFGSLRKAYDEPLLSPSRRTECLQSGMRFAWKNLLHSWMGSLELLARRRLDQRGVIFETL